MLKAIIGCFLLAVFYIAVGALLGFTSFEEPRGLWSYIWGYIVFSIGVIGILTLALAYYFGQHRRAKSRQKDPQP